VETPGLILCGFQSDDIGGALLASCLRGQLGGGAHPFQRDAGPMQTLRRLYSARGVDRCTDLGCTLA
jgi:hypothetical protein